MIKTCVICGKLFETIYPNKKCCSTECSKELNRRAALQHHYAKRKKLDTAGCCICGKTFKPNFLNEHFCSDKCRLKSPLYKLLHHRFGEYDSGVILGD